MIAFAGVAALLIAAGLVWLLRPLLRHGSDSDIRRDASNAAILQDQVAELDADLASGLLTADQHRESRAELERRVLDEVRAAGGASAVAGGHGTRTAIVLAFVIPVAAALLYLQLGSREAFSPEAVAGQGGAGGEHALTQAQVEEMVARLAERMKQTPTDAQGWSMLARTYYYLRRFPEAADAYAKLLALEPANAEVLADYADALAMTQGRQIAGKPMELVERALKLDPNQWKALAMAGTAAFDRKDYAGAVRYWEKLKSVLPPDSEMAKSIDGSIAEARQMAGMPSAPLAAAPSAPASAKPAAADAPDGRVTGVVTLSKTLAEKAKPDDAVFIFARPAEGSRMPLAIVRRQVKDLPFKFVLDDSMAMSPAARLSAFPDVVVGARISKTGSAMPQSGDLEGLSAPVKVGASGLNIVIDRALP